MQKNVGPRKKLACVNSARLTNWMVWYRKIWPLTTCTAQREQGFEFKASYALSITGGLKTKSGASSVSRGNMLEVTLCLEIMRLKIKATNEILRSMFLSHDQSQRAIPRIRLKI
jgi:hypothetical protein